MPAVRQKTVDGRTYKLMKAKTERSGTEYEYYVTENGNPVEDPVYSRSEGDRQFEETIRLVKKGTESNGRGMFGGGGFGIGDPSDVEIPGLTDTDGSNDDDDPWSFF